MWHWVLDKEVLSAHAGLPAVGLGPSHRSGV